MTLADEIRDIMRDGVPRNPVELYGSVANRVLPQTAMRAWEHNHLADDELDFDTKLYVGTLRSIAVSMNSIRELTRDGRGPSAKYSWNIKE